MIRQIKDGGEVLAIHMRTNIVPWPEGEKFLTGLDEILQVGLLTRHSSTVIKPHYHPPLVTSPSRQKGEVIIVKKGLVTANIFNFKGERIETLVLSTGDMLIQLRGGHSFLFQDDTQLIEIKNGPYEPNNDKRYF